MTKEVNVVIIFDEDNEVLKKDFYEDAEMAYRKYCEIVDSYKSMQNDSRFSKFIRTIARYRQFAYDNKPRLMHSVKIVKE